MSDPLHRLMLAVSFAARAHKFQTRKDRETPYVAHVFRVCLVIQQVFGITDPEVLAAALLHDTIEDTPVDYDEVEEQFGENVARWVAALTKDMRMPEPEREVAYAEAIARAGWQVHICKLADMYDNISDTLSLPAEKRLRTFQRSEEYLVHFKGFVAPEAHTAYKIVRVRLDQMKQQAQ
jgi:guanosine-3',5'-bis(diphosphate) 3'-pyrophosphohydrolase